MPLTAVELSSLFKYISLESFRWWRWRESNPRLEDQKYRSVQALANFTSEGKVVNKP